jgi:hypothetical protein
MKGDKMDVSAMILCCIAAICFVGWLSAAYLIGKERF